MNHAGRGYGTEALRVLAEGVAEPADVDRVMRDVAGFRMGPLELFDLTGLDVSHPVMESIYHQFYEEPRFRPSPETARRLAAGLLGRKAGEGFYRYSGTSGRIPQSPRRQKIGRHRSGSAPRSRPRGKVVEFLQALPDAPPFDAGRAARPAPRCASSHPLGVDATTAAIEQSLDPTRVVAVDSVLAWQRRPTLMPTPATPRRCGARHTGCSPPAARR